MEHQLGLVLIRLPAPEAGLADLALALPPANTGSGLTRPEGLEPGQVSAWAQLQRQNGLTALDWAGLHACLSGTQPAGAKACQHLVSLLGWAAAGAVQQLRDAAEGREAAAGVADMGNPRHLAALRNTLKLSLAFLSCVAKGAAIGSSDAGQQPEPAARGGKKARAGVGGEGKAAAAAAAAALSSLHLRRDALLALGAIAKAVSADGSTLLPAVADMRAAERLWQAAARHCLVHPPAGAAGGVGAASVSTKAAAEACYRAAADILERPFLEAAGAADEQAPAQPGAKPACAFGAAAAASARTLQELLGIASEPKQTQHAFTAAARLLSSIAQQSSRAGAAIAARFVDCCAELAAASTAAPRASDAAAAAAALAGQRLDACLHFAAALAAQDGSACTAGPPALAAGLLPCLPHLLPLARHGRASTRRLCLDLFSSLLRAAGQLPGAPPPVAPPQAGGAEALDGLPTLPKARSMCQSALLAALCTGLNDRDATLRAKALACLERHAGVVAAALSTSATTAAGSGGRDGGRASASLSAALLQAVCGRLCDKSPSVRKRAVGLLGALTQHLQAPPGASPSLSAAGAARLADAVLPVASQLLGLRPDSALHSGEDCQQAIAEIVLRLAGQGGSAAGLLPLLQLASSVGEAAPRAQLQAAVLDALLPGGPAHRAAEQLLQRLAALLPHCSTEQVRQLRDAVQAALATGTVGPGTSAGGATAASATVQLCFQRLHATVCSSAAASQPAGAATAAEEQGSAPQPRAALKAAAACLFILGPFSSADFPTRLAEAGLLLSSLLGLASKGGSPEGSACSSASLCWLLDALASAFRQLSAEEHPSAGHEGMPPPSQQHPAAVALMQEAPAALCTLLLSAAGGCQVVRSAAIEAALAAPPAAEAPLRLLRSLVDACGNESIAGARERLPAAPRGERLEPMQAEGTAADAGSNNAAAAHAPSIQAQRQALLSLLELLGAMSAGYERQRAAFQQRLAAEAGQQAGAGDLQHGQQQQQQQGISKAGRRLRPASEWWVGDGQGRPGAGSDEDQQSGLYGPSSAQCTPATSTIPAEAAAGGARDSSFDYMRGEDQAAKQDAAAQRFLDSLLAAADTPPACFLPLLERLAGGRCSEEEGFIAAVPACVQAAALRALGRLAVLSEPLCRSAVQLAERCLDASAVGGHDGSSACSTPVLEVQQAAVSLLADSIDAFPNAFSGKLPLVGRLMVPAAAPAAAQSGAARGDQPAAATAVEAEHLALWAASAYCRLLLRNKLRLQDAGMLAPVGCALAGGGARAAAVARHALRQLLLAAPPKGRARLCLDLFHQTPLERGWRQLLAEELVRPAAGLLPESDLRSDVLASQAVQALLAAAATGSAADTAPGIAAAGALLCAMRPSAKVLASLEAQLEASGPSGAALHSRLPAAASRALVAFVSNHVASAAGTEAEGEALSERAQAGPVGAGAAAQHKRKRTQGGSAALQQRLLQLLRSGGVGGSRHAGRAARVAGTASKGAAASSGAQTAGAAPTASIGAPACSSGGGGACSHAGDSLAA